VLGRLIRERRLAKGLSLAQLAEAIGIGPTSVSLVAAMEHGSIPPRRDVAERLAAVLEVDPEPLLMWSDTRVSPRESSAALQEREEVEALFSRALFSSESARDLDRESDSDREDSDRSPHRIPILPAGADPDRYRGRPRGYLDRGAIERLVGERAALIRPIAYELSDHDYERLRHVAPHGRALHAIVSRPDWIEIDPREPYAIRLGGEVILAYCAWDGRELVVLQPPDRAGFARIKAGSQSALAQHVVGQVVTLNWWEPT
jgi:transcriptional regulator with XRE-family HTH domain